MDEIEKKDDLASEEDSQVVYGAKSIRSSITSNLPSTSFGFEETNCYKTESTIAIAPSATEKVIKRRSVSQVALNPDSQSIATTSDKTSNGSNKAKFSKDQTPELNEEQDKNTRENNQEYRTSQKDNISDMPEHLFYLPLVVSRESMKNKTQDSENEIQTLNKNFQVPMLQVVPSNIQSLVSSFVPTQDKNCKLLPLVQFLPLYDEDKKSVENKQDLLLNLAQAMEKELINPKYEQVVEIEVIDTEDDKSVHIQLLQLVQSIVKGLSEEKVSDDKLSPCLSKENVFEEISIYIDETPFELTHSKSCMDFIKNELDRLIYDFKSFAQIEAEFQLENIINNLPLDTMFKDMDEAQKSESSLSVQTESNELEFIVDENVSLRSYMSKTIENTFLFDNCEIGVCRICYVVDKKNSLISPCRCKGSLSRVHISCLEHWLAESDSSHCEICGFIFDTKRNPRYSLLGSINAWFRSSRNDRKDVFLDVLAAITLAPLAGIGTYIGLIMAEALNFDDTAQSITVGTITGRVAAVSVVSLMTTLDVVYATWAAVRLQNHLNNWYNWYRRNSTVTLNITNGGHT